MDDISKKREALIGAYPGSRKWKTKVIHMSEEQVIAVYLRLKAQGKVA
jgi:hypothetical protein